MALLRWLNGWKLMAIAVAVGYVSYSMWEMLELDTCTRYVDRITGGYYGSVGDEPGPFLIAIILACFASTVVGLIWGLVGLFVRVERSR